MFRFEEPTYLYLLAALPLIAILRWVLERKQLKRLPNNLLLIRAFR